MKEKKTQTNEELKQLENLQRTIPIAHARSPFSGPRKRNSLAIHFSSEILLTIWLGRLWQRNERTEEREPRRESKNDE